MSIKKYISLIIFLILSVTAPVMAQQNLIEKGNRFYDAKKYSIALKFYQRSLKANANMDTQVKLAKCYQLTHQYNKAANLYALIVQNSKALPLHFLEYAQLLKQIRQYKKAKEWLLKYTKLNPANNQIENLINSIDLINELKDDSLYLVKPISINSTQSDFASAFFQNGIAFVSGRENKTSGKINNEIGDYYLDLYYTELKKGKYSSPTPFSSIFNTKYNEGPACFSKNGKFIYFTRNKKGINLEGRSELNIFTARFNGGYWDKPELFQFSGYSYSMGHPSLSPDGQSLYFISNMEGGFGGTDIYVCVKQGFSWSRPVNLGPKINSSGNEMFPFIGDNGFLYFASDGHVGLGGLDIFKSQFDQRHWTYPINLGPPFNSSSDDFAYFVNQNKDFGYFSSNRPGGKGSDDIYNFILNPQRVIPLTGRIRETRDKSPISQVEVTLMSKMSMEKITKTDKQGNFIFNIVPNKNYSLVIRKPGHKTKRILYFANQYNKKRNPQVNIMMDSSTWVKFSGTVIDEYSDHPLKDVTMQLRNNIYHINHLAYTNKDGNYMLDLDPHKSYDIIIRKKGYFTKYIERFRYNQQGPTIKLQPISRNQYTELTKATFGPSKWELNKKTKKILDPIALLLQNNPNIIITLGAYVHEDNGRKENQKITQRRAEEAANYIISQGIAPNRIEIKFHGYSPNRALLTIKVTELF